MPKPTILTVSRVDGTAVYHDRRIDQTQPAIATVVDTTSVCAARLAARIPVAFTPARTVPIPIRRSERSANADSSHSPERRP